MTGEKSDVAIIGGGIMGTSAALFLRKRGLSVTLLERFLVGQQASGVNFGNVRSSGRFIPQLPLSLRAMRIWHQLPELIGHDCEFIPSSRIQFAFDEARVAIMEDYADKANRYGLNLRIMSKKELLDSFPWLSPDAVAGSYAPYDGHANPRLISPAFAKAAALHGAKIIENCALSELERDGSEFIVHTADNRQFRAAQVLVTAGAWADKIASSMGEPVPLVVRGPQLAVTEPVRYFMRPAVGLSTAIPDETVYFRQVERGNIVIGGGGSRGPASADDVRAYINPANTLNQIQQLSRMVPQLKNISLLRTWSGIESYLPDDLPVIGPSGKVAGLHYAFGFCGHGFQLGPGVGDTMAELIATGRTDTPLEPFHITRFADGTLKWKTPPK